MTEGKDKSAFELWAEKIKSVAVAEAIAYAQKAALMPKVKPGPQHEAVKANLKMGME
jgi:hypothetical protein